MNIPPHVNPAGEETRTLRMLTTASNGSRLQRIIITNNGYSWPPLMYFLLETVRIFGPSEGWTHYSRFQEPALMVRTLETLSWRRLE